jgi:hypothetical protein
MYKQNFLKICANPSFSIDFHDRPDQKYFSEACQKKYRNIKSQSLNRRNIQYILTHKENYKILNKLYKSSGTEIRLSFL